MVIYFSCKYYKTTHNAPLDVKASQDWSPQHCVQWDWWESTLCLTSVLIFKPRGHFSGQKWRLCPNFSVILARCTVKTALDSELTCHRQTLPSGGSTQCSTSCMTVDEDTVQWDVFYMSALVHSKDRLRVSGFIFDCLESENVLFRSTKEVR